MFSIRYRRHQCTSSHSSLTEIATMVRPQCPSAINVTSKPGSEGVAYSKPTLPNGLATMVVLTSAVLDWSLQLPLTYRVPILVG